MPDCGCDVTSGEVRQVCEVCPVCQGAALLRRLHDAVGPDAVGRASDVVGLVATSLRDWSARLSAQRGTDPPAGATFGAGPARAEGAGGGTSDDGGAQEQRSGR